MKLKTRLALLATTALTLAPTLAHADPISAAIAAIATWVGTASTATLIAIGTATLSLGMDIVSMVMGGPANPAMGITGKMSVGGIVPQAFPVGETAIDGTLVYVNTWGNIGKTPNAYLVQVIAISDLPAALTGIVCNGTVCTLNSTISTTHPEFGTPIPEFQISNENYLWYKFYDGTQTAADSFLISAFGNDQVHPYSANRVGTGRAYVIMTARINPHLFSGFPRFKFVSSGIALYDPRKDSTVGGSGTHVWGQSSTYEPTTNPQVIRYNLRRGIYYGDLQQWMIGGQNVPAARLPFDNWTAAMNACDATVSVPSAKYSGTCTLTTQGTAGSRVAVIDLVDEFDVTNPTGFSQLGNGAYIQVAEYQGIVNTNTGTQITTEPGWAGTNGYASPVEWVGWINGGSEAAYRGGGEIKCDTPPASVDESLIRACNARAMEIGGVYKTTTGVIGSSVYSFTDDDVIIDQKQTMTEFPGLSGLVNGITATYPDPTTWNTADAPPLYDATLEAEDGNRRNVVNITFDAVPFPNQVQRLMQEILNERRRFRTHDLVLQRGSWMIEPGDAVSWTSQKNGYTNKLFRVESVSPLPNRDIHFLIREADPTDGDFNALTDYSYAPLGTIAPLAVATQQMTTLTATPVSVAGDNGMAVPGVQLSWDTTEIDDVASVMWQIVLASSGAIVATGQEKDWTNVPVTVTTGLLPNTAYQVKAQYVPPSTSPRQTIWSAFVSFTTTNTQITKPQIAPGTVDASLIGPGAVTIGPGGNVGGAVDASGYPAIDFSYSGHLNKNLDQIANGQDYARVPLSGLYGSGLNTRAFVDFASGYNLNQNADYIAPGATWSPVRIASLTGGNVDLALSGVQNRSLAYIQDAVNRYAVKNGGSLNGVATVDSANLAAINFASGVHLNQNADYMPAGTTWSPVKLASLTGGNVDLSLSGVQGRTLANIQDAVNRYAVTNGANLKAVASVDPNNLALIDFAQGGHSNKNLGNIADGGGRYAAAEAGADVTANHQSATTASLANQTLDGLPDGNTTQRTRMWVLPEAGAGWFNLGTWTFGASPATLYLRLLTGSGFSPLSNQHAVVDVYARSGNVGAGGSSAPNISGCSWQIFGGSTPILNMKLVASGTNVDGTGRTWDLYVDVNNYSGGVIQFTPDANNSFSYSGAAATDPGAASGTVVVGTGGQYINPSAGTGLDGIYDGASYYRMPAANMDASRRGLIDFSQGGHLNKSLKNIADDPTSGRYAAAEAGADVTASHTSALTASLSNQTQDALANGSTYGRTALSRLNGANPIIDFADGANLNKNLDNLSNGSTNVAAKTWNFSIGGQSWVKLGTWHFSTVPSSLNLTILSGIGYNTNANQQSSTQIFARSANVGAGGASAPNISGVNYVTYGGSPAVYNVKLVSSDGSGGLGDTWDVYVFFGSYTGGTVQFIPDPNNSFTWGFATASDPGTPSATIVQGTRGQYSETLHQSPVTIGSYGAGWNGMSLSYTASGGSATISVSAATLKTGSNSLGYNASSVGVSGTAGTNVDYYLYYNDQHYSAGSQTPIATTSFIDVTSGIGYIYIGQITVSYPSSGTGSGGGSVPPCVCIETALPGYERAGDVEVGNYLDLANPVTFEPRKGLVSYAKTETVPCVRFETESGIELECSIYAPIAIEGGEMVLAPNLAGKRIPVCDYGEWRIETVVMVEPVGLKQVRHITCENDLFLAGAQKGRYVLHHNAKS